jgi:citrate lyase subunit beta/citryl-CoA lyase
VRSLLFAPGDSDRKITKALQAGAEAVVLDLEDAVAPAAKAEARRRVRERMAGERPVPIVVRVNGADTSWHLEDLAAVSAAAPDYVMLPKCAGPADLARLHHQLDALEAVHGHAPGRIRIIPLATETAASVRRLDYRDVTARLAALAFGGEDLAADLGVAARDEHGALNPLLDEARRALAFAAAEAGVPAIDTPYPDPRDAVGLEREAREAARLGFAGKLCIHPQQIEAAHAAFAPDANQIRWAEAVVAAFAETPLAGVATLDGKMIDKAHLRLAQRRLAAANKEGNARRG